MYIYMYVYLYVYVCINIYIHTSHTYTLVALFLTSIPSDCHQHTCRCHHPILTSGSTFQQILVDTDFKELL